MTLLPLAAGAAGGLGLTAVISAAWPAPVRLDAALTRLETTDPAPPAADGGGPGRWLAAQLAASGRIAIPRADLELLGRTQETFLIRKIGGALAGLASFSLASLAAAAVGVRVPWEAPVIVTLAVAAALFFVPDMDVRADAARRRRDFRWAWGSYLQLVRLARAAGAGTTDALLTAAGQGTGWAFSRIRAALDSAADAREPLWQGLARLGQEIGVPEVSDLADTIRMAGSEGTRIGDTLAAAAASLQDQLAADMRAQANSRTITMIVPLSVLTLGFIVLLAYPAFATLLTTP